jgi:lambda family phage portal protein
MDGYSEAEIIRARTQALTTSVIETPQATTSLGTEVEEDGSVSMELEAGVLKRLNPGERIGHGEATSPNPSLDPFMRYMLREIASGVGVSYESLSRDYSQSNYSSSRLALLDDRDLWRYLQQWFILDFRQKVHERWLQQAILAGAIPSISVGEYAINPGRFAEARFKPRGWTWVDPTKEVQAYQEAVKSSFTTVEDVIAQTGGGMDLEEVLEQRAKELEMMKSKGLVFETSPEFYNKQPKATSPPTAQGEPPMRVVKRSHE